MHREGWRVTEEKRCVIPSLPPSVNAIYQIIFAQRRVEMKPEVRAWKTKAKEYVPRLNPMAESYLVTLDVTFTYNWFFKNGKLKKFDSQNLLKVLIDAVAEKAGFNDEIVKMGSWNSIHSEEKEQVEVVIRQVTNEESHGSQNRSI